MKLKTQNGFLWLTLAGCFLWNPVIGMQDILPDAVGYLLLCVGLSKLADLSDVLFEAQRAFRAMLWVGLGRLLAYLLTDVLLASSADPLNPYERPMWVLLLSFVFLIFEWYYLLRAWRAFFGGLFSLAQFGGGSTVLREKKGKTAFERMTKCSLAFVVLHSLLNLLPELTILTSFEKDAENPLFRFDWYLYADLFRAVAGIASLIIGAVWLISYLRLMLSASRDSVWQQELTARYEKEILPNTALLLGRRIGASFAFFRVGMVFFINLSLSYRQLLPDWLGVLFFACGVLLLGSFFKEKKLFWSISLLLFCVGVAKSICNTIYLREYIPKDALYLPQAYRSYQAVKLLGIAESVLMLLLCLLLLRLLLQMVKSHVSVAYHHPDDPYAREATLRRRKFLNRRAVLPMVLLSLATVLKLAELWLQQIYGWFWLLQFAVSFAALLSFHAFLSELSDSELKSEP